MSDDGRTQFNYSVTTALADPVYDYLKKFYVMATSQENGILEDNDIECLHIFRTSLRRMRAVLRTFVYPVLPERGRKLQAHVKSIMLQTGMARDIDVLLEFYNQELVNYDICSDRLSFDCIYSILKTIKDGVSQQTHSYIMSKKYKSIKREIILFIDLLKSPKSRFLTIKYYDIIPERIKKKFKDIYRKNRSVWNGNSEREQLHNFRKTLKRLRYSLEMIAPSFPGMLDDVLTYYKEVQDSLGAIHDYDVWIHEFSRIANEKKEPALLVTISEIMLLLKKKRDEEYKVFSEHLVVKLRKKEVKAAINEVFDAIHQSQLSVTSSSDDS